MHRKIMGALAALAVVLPLALSGIAPAQAAAPSPSMPAGLDSGAKPKGVKALKGNPGKITKTGTVASTSQRSLSGYNYYYNVGQQVLPQSPNTAMGGKMSCSTTSTAPYVRSTDYHSLCEINVQANNANGLNNAVEVGWINSRSGVCGANVITTCLFIYSWKDGSDVNTCYNGCGWVDDANNPLDAGDPLPTGTHTFEIENQSDYWRIKVDGSWIGYFPPSHFSSAWRVGIDSKYYEVVSPNLYPCTDMGNGLVGGNAGASAIWGAQYLNGGVWTNNTFITAALQPGGGSLLSGTYELGNVGTNSFRGGGPGWNNTGTAVGTAGTC
jgi:hypothetical protein